MVNDAGGWGHPPHQFNFFLTAGQTSDYIGAWALLGFLPKATALLTDRGYEADWFRKALNEREIFPCIPGRKARKVPVEYDAELNKERRRIENMFGHLKAWRFIATRYDRCADMFLSACCHGTVVLYWL